MKRLLAIVSFIALSSTVFTSCKKEEVLNDDIVLKSFTFEPNTNEGLNKSIQGVIEGKKVFIRIPNAVDGKAAIPTFVTNYAQSVGFIGNTVVESGVTPIDLSKPTTLRLSAEGSMTEYIVEGVKSASILSFGFFAEDNEGVLFKDYKATITKLNINVELPVDADITSLVARYTTTSGATVKFQGSNFQSQVTALDYSNEVELSLTDAEMEGDETFTVTVGRLTAPVWTAMTLPDFLLANATTAIVEINPLTNQPYLMIQKSGSNDIDRKGVMGGLDATSNTWFSVGDENGFSATRVDAISFTFDNKGTIYSAYKDYTVGTRKDFGSVMAYKDNKWEYVGEQQSLFGKAGYMTIRTDANDVPYVGYVLSAALSPYVNRTPYIESFQDGSWKGGTITPTSTGYYARMVKGRDNQLYYLTMDLTSGSSVRKPSVYKLINGTWTLVGNMNVGPTTSNSGGFNVDLDATEDGKLYLTYQSNSPSYATYVMQWDGTSWNQLGDGIAQTTNGSANRDNVAIKIHPDGRIFFAYSDANNGVRVTTFNKETGNWNTPSVLNTENGSKLELRIAEDGVVYLATIINSKAALFKYDIPGK